jgi:hypothetical protein
MSMRRQLNVTSVMTAVLVGTISVTGGLVRLTAQTTPQRARPARPARTPDGKPNLNGIWQAVNSANWDLLDHAAKPSPVVAMGAVGSIPAGIGVVEGGEIPYKPEALAKKKENEANWLQRDPTVKCYMPGIPRATYMPFPFQITQTPEKIMMAYEFASASRTIYMNSKEESPLPFWMGWSRGHWEGDTLVVVVDSFTDQTWFDASGDFHSDQLKVTERYSPIDATHMNYEATIEDPDTFTKPWKIRMPLYRRIEDNAQLLEFKCIEFVEELMYGHLRKRVQ